MMDDLVNLFNGGILVLFALGALYVAIMPQFETRIVLTIGLGAVGVGAGAMGVWMLVGTDPWDLSPLNRAIALLNFGIITSVAGYVHHVLKRPKSGGMSFPELNRSEQRQVSGGHKS